MQISITEMTAVPSESKTPLDMPTATPEANLTPIPITSTINGGVNAAAWSQRTDFHHQFRS
jgi:hypothetical protein